MLAGRYHGDFFPENPLFFSAALPAGRNRPLHAVAARHLPP